MSAGGATGTGPFRAAYASALLDYLLQPTETSLRVAYELAREAVSRSFSVLDLAVAHQEALGCINAEIAKSINVRLRFIHKQLQKLS